MLRVCSACLNLALWLLTNGILRVFLACQIECKSGAAQSFQEFAIPTLNAQPYGLTQGPDGSVWFVEHDANKIGRISTTGVITEYAIPTANSIPIAIAQGPDDALYFTEYNDNKIGRITFDGAITEFAIPTANSQPWSISQGPNNALFLLPTKLAA